jgi:hypothetical protein
MIFPLHREIFHTAYFYVALDCTVHKWILAKLLYNYFLTLSCNMDILTKKEGTYFVLSKSLGYFFHKMFINTFFKGQECLRNLIIEIR